MSPEVRILKDAYVPRKRWPPPRMCQILSQILCHQRRIADSSHSVLRRQPAPEHQVIDQNIMSSLDDSPLYVWSRKIRVITIVEHPQRVVCEQIVGIEVLQIRLR